MAIQIQLRRGTASEWSAANPILAQGEFGYESDTSKFKVGDGSTSWSTLSYAVGGLSEATASATYLSISDAVDTYLPISASSNYLFASTASVTYAPLNISEVEKTTDFSLTLTDAGKLLRVNSASAVAVTVPVNASAAFTIGTTVLLYRAGSEPVTISGAAGVTIRSLNSASAISGQYGQASLIKRDTDEWLLAGNIE